MLMRMMSLTQNIATLWPELWKRINHLITLHVLMLPFLNPVKDNYFRSTLVKLERRETAPVLLLNTSLYMPWPYMLRFGYFKKCRIVETFVTDTRGSHESCFLISIHAYADNFRHLKEAQLYMYYSEWENAHSAMTDIRICSHSGNAELPR